MYICVTRLTESQVKFKFNFLNFAFISVLYVLVLRFSNERFFMGRKESNQTNKRFSNDGWPVPLFALVIYTVGLFFFQLILCLVHV